jgi:hypothetical protein
MENFSAQGPEPRHRKTRRKMYVRGRPGDTFDCRVVLSGCVKPFDASLSLCRVCIVAGGKSRAPVVAQPVGKPLLSRVGTKTPWKTRWKNEQCEKCVI